MGLPLPPAKGGGHPLFEADEVRRKRIIRANGFNVHSISARPATRPRDYLISKACKSFPCLTTQSTSDCAREPQVKGSRVL